MIQAKDRVLVVTKDGMAEYRGTVVRCVSPQELTDPSGGPFYDVVLDLAPGSGAMLVPSCRLRHDVDH